MKFCIFILMTQLAIGLISCSDSNDLNAPPEIFTDSVSVIVDGIYTIKESYRNGKIRDRESFADGKRNGLFLNYFFNGTIQLEQRYLDDKLIGSAYSFYSSGRSESYNCYNLEGNTRRVKVYDTLDNLVKDEGVLVVQVKVYSDSLNRIKANSRIFIDAVVATPPNEKVNVVMYLNNRQITGNLHLENNIARLDTTLSIKGEYRLLTRATSIDSITKKNYEDSVVTTFDIY